MDFICSSMLKMGEWKDFPFRSSGCNFIRKSSILYFCIQARNLNIAPQQKMKGMSL